MVGRHCLEIQGKGKKKEDLKRPPVGIIKLVITTAAGSVDGPRWAQASKAARSVPLQVDSVTLRLLAMMGTLSLTTGRVSVSR